jgi:hypothetical protein
LIRVAGGAGQGSSHALRRSSVTTGGDALTIGASPDHCYLFGKEARAFARRIVEVLSIA